MTGKVASDQRVKQDYCFLPFHRCRPKGEVQKKDSVNRHWRFPFGNYQCCNGVPCPGWGVPRLT